MPKGTLSPITRLYRLLKLDRKDIFQTFYYAIFAGLLNLSVPLGIQAIVNLIQGGRVSTSWIVLVVLVTVAVGFVGVMELLQIRIVENIQQKIFTRSSFEFTYRFPKIKTARFKNLYPPELANRFFDTLTVQKGVAKLLLDFPAALLQIFFGLILLSLYHPFFIIFGILLISLIYLVFRYTARRGLEASLDESKHKYKVAHWLQEVARSLLSFKLSGRTSYAMNRNDTNTLKYLEHRENHFKVLKIQYIKLIIFKVLVTGGLLAIGGLLVLNQQMNIGQFVAAEIIILLILGSVEKLIKGLETTYDVLTSLEKLGQVLDMDLEASEGGDILKDDMPVNIEVADVSFTVKEINRTILKNITLDLPQGKRLLIKGINGSGRTSLLKLLAGVTEASSGNIFVNDHSFRSISPNNYRSRVGVYFTEEAPFEGSILDNITLGDPSIDDRDIAWAIEKVGLTEFVKYQPKGLKTVIASEGKYLSALISKKIILARAIAKKPAILILKEPLEGFDKDEANKLLLFLAEETHNWSLLVASQNEAWENICDEIIELEKGEIKIKKEMQRC